MSANEHMHHAATRWLRRNGEAITSANIASRVAAVRARCEFKDGATVVCEAESNLLRGRDCDKRWLVDMRAHGI